MTISCAPNAPPQPPAVVLHTGHHSLVSSADPLRNELAGVAPQSIDAGNEAEVGQRPSAIAYPLHDIALLFPDTDEETQEELQRSIGERGLLKSILRWRRCVVDGRHRLAACEAEGIEPHFEDLPDEMPKSEVLSRVLDENAHRRHLTSAQRAMTAARLTLMKGEDAEETNLSLNVKDAAKALGVSEMMVKHARTILMAGVEAADVVPVVNRGDLALDVAANAVRLKLVPDILRAGTAQAARLLVARALEAELPNPTPWRENALFGTQSGAARGRRRRRSPPTPWDLTQAALTEVRTTLRGLINMGMANHQRVCLRRELEELLSLIEEPEAVTVESVESAT